MQSVKTKKVQVRKLKTNEIQAELLENLTLEEILQFIQELSQKTLQKKKAEKSQQKRLPPHIREGIKESLEEYERGEYTTLSTDQEIDEYLENLLA